MVYRGELCHRESECHMLLPYRTGATCLSRTEVNIGLVGKGVSSCVLSNNDRADAWCVAFCMMVVACQQEDPRSSTDITHVGKSQLLRRNGKHAKGTSSELDSRLSHPDTI